LATSLDRLSIELLRLVSRGGWAGLGDLARALSIPEDEVVGRLEALKHCGVIASFHAVPFLPALAGGVWGRYVVRLHPSERGLGERLAAGLEGLEETLHNAVFFTRRLPCTVLFVFSKTQEELDLLLRETGADAKPLLIKAYNFPFPTSLSPDERSLLRALNRTGEVAPAVLAERVGRDPVWVKTKLRRLVLHSDNPQGVAVLRATIRWYAIDNFIHAHLLLPQEAKESLAELFAGLTWSPLKWPAESSETVAVEVDFAGWGGLAAWKERVELAGFPLGGFALFAEERIWGKGFEF